MLFVKYLFTTVGFGLLVGAVGILIYDLYLFLRPLPSNEAETPPEPSVFAPRWSMAARVLAVGLIPLLMGLSIHVVPSGQAGIRISQLQGTLPGTLYPGVHWTVPLMERVELFNTRDQIYSTSLLEDSKKKLETLRVQTKEGLGVGLAVTVRYKLDASKLPYLYGNLPQPVETELVPPAISSAFREAAPNYTVREVFAGRRDQMVRTVAGQIAQKLASDGIIVKEVLLRDIELPSEYAKGLEGLLLKEQENERMSVELELKQKMVKEADLEAEAQKARDVKAAEARAEVTVLEAKAQADAMQHTLPLKEKQIQQSRLEAEARKAATLLNAEATAEAKIIDSKAELEKRKLTTEGEADRIRHVAEADSERLRLEAEVLKQNPLLIQKIIAEKLSDKVQIMMVPNDGKFFFANDVLKGLPASATAAATTP
ncbi:MAG: SPFH domain-containing protein [Bryobacteraceae bacterium]|jgi:regulator of protease activity HflC (stomatin/prohibitin superfamily)